MRWIALKRKLFILLVCVVMYAVWHGYHTGTFDPHMIEDYYRAYPVTTIALFIAVYALFVVTLLPSLPLNLAAGFFWGGLVGGIYSTVAVTLGGWFAFLLARWFIGDTLPHYFNAGWMLRAQEEFDRNGWKFVAFARLNPIIPTGPLNYLLGLTSLSSLTFLAVTFWGLLPLSVAVAYIGSLLQTCSEQRGDVSTIINTILVVSGVITLVVFVKFVARMYRK